jgi:site-specific recombinase XerD
VSEVANLRVSDINSKRMVIRVEQGKGKKDRATPSCHRGCGAAAGVVADWTADDVAVSGP